MENIDFSYIGPMLKAARIEAEMTQETLAEQIDITTRYIMVIENESKRPALDVFFCLHRTHYFIQICSRIPTHHTLDICTFFRVSSG